jgi:hypothetical protein
MKILRIEGFRNMLLFIPSTFTTEQINEFVSQQEWWSNLMGDIESFGTSLKLDETGNFEISDDNGRISVILMTDVETPSFEWQLPTVW